MKLFKINFTFLGESDGRSTLSSVTNNVSSSIHFTEAAVAEAPLTPCSQSQETLCAYASIVHASAQVFRLHFQT